MKKIHFWDFDTRITPSAIFPQVVQIYNLLSKKLERLQLLTIVRSDVYNFCTFQTSFVINKVLFFKGMFFSQILTLRCILDVFHYIIKLFLTIELKNSFQTSVSMCFYFISIHFSKICIIVDIKSGKLDPINRTPKYLIPWRVHKRNAYPIPTLPRFFLDHPTTTKKWDIELKIGKLNPFPKVSAKNIYNWGRKVSEI